MLVDPFRFGVPAAPPGGTLELLAHMTADFADSSGIGRSPTASGPTVNSTQTLFGLPTGEFGGTVSYPDAANLDIGTQAFTLEGWLFLSSLPAGTRALCSHSRNTAFNFNVHEFIVYVNNSGNIGVTVGRPTSTETKAQSTGAVSTGAFFHWAVCRGADLLDVYVDGARVASASLLDSVSLTTSDNTLILGGVGADSTPYAALACRMGQFRYTQGARLYSGTSYTVPAGPFPDP